MDEMELNIKIEEFVRYNLSLELKDVGSSYGSKPYTIIQLKLRNEVISEVYLDK